MLCLQLSDNQLFECISYLLLDNVWSKLFPRQIHQQSNQQLFLRGRLLTRHRWAHIVTSYIMSKLMQWCIHILISKVITIAERVFQSTSGYHIFGPIKHMHWNRSLEQQAEFMLAPITWIKNISQTPLSVNFSNFCIKTNITHSSISAHLGISVWCQKVALCSVCSMWSTVQKMTIRLGMQ